MSLLTRRKAFDRCSGDGGFSDRDRQVVVGEFSFLPRLLPIPFSDSLLSIEDRIEDRAPGEVCQLGGAGGVAGSTNANDSAGLMNTGEHAAVGEKGNEIESVGTTECSVSAETSGKQK